MKFQIPLYLQASSWLSRYGSNNHAGNQEVIRTGNFENPAVQVRPRFRYWIPDASANFDAVAKDIQSIAAAGAGGFEVLGYYNYGDRLKSSVPADWATYGWGTPAWKKLFDALITAHHDHGLIMDFAMGPNQGQGVPAHPDDEGLMWDLNLHWASIPVNGSFSDILPGWGDGKLQAALTGIVTKSVHASSRAPSLPNNLPYHRLEKTLATSSLSDVTSQVGSHGHLDLFFSNDTAPGIERIVFGVYLSKLGARNQAPPWGSHSPPKDFIHNGSWTVDHFSTKGAKVMTDFWEKYLLTDGTKERLKEVGNYAWEDSVEINSNVYWSKEIPNAFEKRRGYSVNKWLPILFHQNSLEPHFRTWFITDEEDAGNSHIADYRTTLEEQYGEYLGALNKWTKDYLGLQFSAQVGYNMAGDMQTNIPIVDVPETECLAAFHNLDAYRQYSGPANLAGKRVISTESGAHGTQTYQQPLTELVWDFKRSIVGSVNNIVIHGYPYSGYCPNTTWPGFTTFTYSFAEMHGPRQPAWDFYSDSLGYIARLQTIFQTGVPKMDVVFYHRWTGYRETPRSYLPDDLETLGYSYSYLNPDNLQRPEAYVANGILAPGRQEYKALIVSGSDSLTVPGVSKIAEFAHQGLPVFFYDGIPSYLASYNSSGAEYAEKTLESLRSLENVREVTAGGLADALASSDIHPLTRVRASTIWYTYWRRNEATDEDYVFVFNDWPYGIPKLDSPSSQGTVEFVSTGKPYLLDAWTGAQTPILNYTQTSGTTTIYFHLAANQAVIVAFSKREQAGLHAVSTSENVLAIVPSDGDKLIAHVANISSTGSEARVTTSDGKVHSLPVKSRSPFTLANWTLIVEHWDAPDPLDDPTVLAERYNTTHSLSSLKSWQHIKGLQKVSGRGYYNTSFKWDVENDTSGALISFGSVVHTLRARVNGKELPALDTSAATADISKYLVNGTNIVEAVVSTMLGNVLEPIWDDLRVLGVPPAGAFGWPTKPSGTTDYGLLKDVVITPYRAVDVTAPTGPKCHAGGWLGGWSKVQQVMC